MTSAAVPNELRPKRLGSIALAWTALCVITLVSWWLSPAHSLTSAVRSVPVSVTVVVLGIIKCRMIIRYFMEVESAPRWLRLATDGWLLALWGGVLGIYLY